METKSLFLSEINNNNPHDIDDEINKFTNRFIKISNDLENFHYNVIIASLHQMCSHLLNEINKGYKETLILNYKNTNSNKPNITILSNSVLR